MERAITLTTDFGLKDGYVGSVKGVILSINPRAAIIDISHSIKPQDIIEGAFVLYQSYSYFPSDTIHLAVVDPGVGGKRKPILIETDRYIFLGPDNGIFSLVLKKETPRRYLSLTKEKYFLGEVSHTFHGRDIFAPVAARLTLGEEPLNLGEEIREIEMADWGNLILKGDSLEGMVLHIDRFGNLITNISKEDILSLSQDSSIQIGIGKRVIKGLLSTYSDGKVGEPIALMGSLNLLEVACYMDSAQKVLGASRLDPVVIERI